ncbi:MAG: phosphoadenosine phosphosulfate reductase family protein [Prevotellaceae bacterium]|jgi:sulfate adenylyltransferase subunit 2|nr:phosphoadenosine phosphosulfate reductase family protein [Prevotellaceae bacterium]
MVTKIGLVDNVISSVGQKSDRAILFFSCGKDSIALLDFMASFFREIVCVFMYFVKDLEHIDKYLRWAQARYKNVKIIQVPHWNLTYILRSGIYCVPNPKIKLLKLRDVDNAIRLQTGIEYSFFGMKKADSMNRRLMLNTYESNNYISNTNRVYPLSEMTNKEIVLWLKQRKLPESVRYSKNASGGVGFNLNCYLYLRKNYPADLEKILHAFPMSEKILIDYDNKQNDSRTE